MRTAIPYVCPVVFALVFFPVAALAVDALPGGVKPLNRNAAVPLTKSECEALGGDVEHEGDSKYCGGKGMCVVDTKGSIYGSCITQVLKQTSPQGGATTVKPPVAKPGGAAKQR